MCDPYDKAFPTVPWILTVWPWAWPLTYFWKNFNIGHNFFIIRDRAFILGMCPATRRVPYSNHSVLLSVLLSVCLSVRQKNFNIDHNFFTLTSDWEEIFANGPFSAFFNDFEIFYGPFLIILHRLWWAISQVNGTMAHGPLPSQSLPYR